jgi:hypothetical protein
MKRAGKKYTAVHTTHIEAAAGLLDFANDHPLVQKISLGFISAIPSSRTSPNRIKFIHEPACLYVKVRGNRAVQEFRFFTTDVQQFEKEFKKFTRSQGFEI